MKRKDDGEKMVASVRDVIVVDVKVRYILVGISDVANVRGGEF